MPQERVAAWDKLPHAHFAHPREEHLLPLMVIAGAALPLVIGSAGLAALYPEADGRNVFLERLRAGDGRAFEELVASPGGLSLREGIRSRFHTLVDHAELDEHRLAARPMAAQAG